ncbi:MAG: hypothetical protein OXP71_01245 [Candidatus Poribacteria bacterium]|nr:hypothetical protein [Candidatus Poribacteria bacterium]
MTFGTRNAVGLAAQHTDRTGHTTTVETGHYYTFFLDGNEEGVLGDREVQKDAKPST